MLVALILGSAERARITRALQGVSAVHFCELGSELAESAGRTGARAILTELHDRRGTSIAPTIQAVRARHPALPILVYLSFRSLRALDVRELVAIAARMAVSDVVFRDVEDVGAALRSTLCSAHQALPTAEIRSAIQPLVPPQLWPFFASCLTGAAVPITVADAASMLGIPRRTLAERLHRAGLPGPRRLLGWCRLLHAARLMEDPERSLEQIANTLDFPSASALHNLLRRYTGLSAAAVRERGGLTVILAAFTQELGGRERRAGTRHAG